MAAGGDEARDASEARRRGAKESDDTLFVDITGDEGSALAPETIDWTAMKAVVLQGLQRSRIGAMATSKSGSRLRDIFSPDDVMQEAIAEQLAQWNSGTPLPRTLAELETELIAKARRRWKAWLKRGRERDRVKPLVKLDATLTARDLFEVICARDECAKFFAALAESLDAEAQVILLRLLKEGIAFGDTRTLAQTPGMNEVIIHNIKRRILSHSRRIMSEMVSTKHMGGAS